MRNSEGKFACEDFYSIFERKLRLDLELLSDFVGWESGFVGGKVFLILNCWFLWLLMVFKDQKI